MMDAIRDRLRGRDRGSTNSILAGLGGLVTLVILWLTVNPLVTKFTNQYNNTSASTTTVGQQTSTLLPLYWGILPGIVVMLFVVFVLYGAYYEGGGQ